MKCIPEEKEEKENARESSMPSSSALSSSTWGRAAPAATGRLTEESSLKIRVNKLLDTINQSEELQDKFWDLLDDDSFLLKTEDARQIKQGEKELLVVEPQCYSSVSVLHSRSFMFEGDSDIGYFYGSEVAVSGSGSDVWIVVNEYLVRALEQIIRA